MGPFTRQIFKFSIGLSPRGRMALAAAMGVFSMAPLAVVYWLAGSWLFGSLLTCALSIPFALYWGRLFDEFLAGWNKYLAERIAPIDARVDYHAEHT